ncbi:MAG: DUF1178 family protein [Hyphomicrobium sp.]|uniref:DUF1178 family protein n=1 Tax=Hyphomicrobium sp. TaxID=82 RepID=UPI001322A499|nr:DUF1178 family protein [Hyphomicrobium sp.]KAB2943905.1 MAG: DUF1178 family protein [Hyphomicrobium sp.]MBZ0208810.1 DUF1178 family protein [Hyphomicrobium sp.]
MIRYRLQCAHAHEFEAWFASSASYDAQAAGGHITCPECNSREVGKSIMAPNVALRARGEVAIPDDEAPARYRNLVREVRRVLVSGSEDVGARFPEEARKIHYREVEQRAIRGTASPDEARALVEEGVEIMALPRLPEDAN